VYRTLKDAGLDVRYSFGVDDLDPLDEIPAGQDEFFEPYLGAPLCNVPAPPGSEASDVAKHFIGEFFDIFDDLGVRAETYYLRDIYRSGIFNGAIEQILHKAHIVREVYLEVSGARRPENWYPFQVICENCGKIGTTVVTDFDGKRVRYTCHADLVKWATGCGHEGQVSPFDGRGKLPWKLEWTAKWHVFGVTIEGAGKDHTTKGGSRDVAGTCLQRVFGDPVPKNIPYEFFLVGGAKMSSSRGVGVSARQMANLLPAEVLRYLMIRTQPRQPVNFSPEEAQITKLFNDFDRLRSRCVSGDATEDERDVLRLSCTNGDEKEYYVPSFQLVVTLIQMPHIDIFGEVEKRKEAPLTDGDRSRLQERIDAARVWLTDFADEGDRIVVHQDLPPSSGELGVVARGFLTRLAVALASVKTWREDDLQSLIFTTARATPIGARDAFEAVYCAFLDRKSGPKAGCLLACLERQFVVERLRQFPYSLGEFWLLSSIDENALEEWLSKERVQIGEVGIEFQMAANEVGVPGGGLGHSLGFGMGVVEFSFSFIDGKVEMKRLIFGRFEGYDVSQKVEIDYFREYAKEYVQDLVKRHGLRVEKVEPSDALGASVH
jgi:lysyl-tRNA synthetase class 1